MSFEDYLFCCLIFIGILAYFLYQSGQGDHDIKPFKAMNGERFASNWHCLQVNLIIQANDGLPRLYKPRIEEYKRENGLV